MADLSKLKRGTLGAPPPMDEASPNLQAPEVAPSPVPSPASAAPEPEPAPAPHIEPPRPRRDGRSARRTHRTLPFATRVSPEFDNRVRDIAERDNLMLVEVLERAVDAYERLHRKR